MSLNCHVVINLRVQFLKGKNRLELCKTLGEKEKMNPN